MIWNQFQQLEMFGSGGVIEGTSPALHDKICRFLYGALAGQMEYGDLWEQLNDDLREDAGDDEIHSRPRRL